MKASRWKSELLAVQLSLVSNALMLRDRLLRVTRNLRIHDRAEHCTLASNARTLAAIWVPPEEGRPVVLVCHGIGETVEHWSAVQALLRDHGIGSLVFNYSGYGRSSGRIRPNHYDEDLIAAYSEISRRILPETPIYLLGFSLGSGIAAAGAASLRPPIAGLFLCESFDSFRNAAHAAGAPRWITEFLPDLWNTASNVGNIHSPIYIIHSDADRLFPINMAQKTASRSENAELLIVEGFSHNEAYMTAALRYWMPIIEKINRT
jgi:alpha-beta hydrolase superfamily lysophospholipase